MEEFIAKSEPIGDQFYKIIYNKITNREYPPGTKLPSERELAASFNISHITVNKIIKQLEAVGKVEIKRGVGVFVNDSPRGYELIKIQSFKEWCDDRGYKSKAEVISFRPAIAKDLRDFDHFNGKPKAMKAENYLFMERLRLLKRTPVIYERRLINNSLVKQEDMEKMGDSYTQFLTKKLNLQIKISHRRLRIVKTTPKLIKYLKLSPREKILEIDGITKDRRNKIIDYENVFYHSDYFEFVYTLQS